MIDTTEIKKADTLAIEIFTFNIMGINFGIDTEQIVRLIDPDIAKEQKLDLLWFHEKILLANGNVVYESPKVLEIKTDEPAFGIIVDHPGEILNIKIDFIKPMPTLIEASGRSTPVWGAALSGEQIVLLVDPYKFYECSTII